MPVSRWHRVHELFEEARGLPAEEQRSFLGQACGNDAELLAEVESLLDHHAAAPAEFLRSPDPGHGSLEQPGDRANDPRIGTRVAGYDIKSVIAAGGMGTVYEAVQEEPRRVVALKIMHRHVASRSALRRFQFESQILAHLRHPNIAHVFVAGMHNDDSGKVPFFAMEYIPGAKTLTQYASSMKLGTRDRLRLFSKVCDAIHHGHQKGIIHRDLKPANILVDSSGEPKVIDFGVARGTDSDLAITTQQTNVGQLVGTIQYMSPEQCDADPHDLDTRSDVYSLGIVLYELLTGQLPYDASSSTIYQATRVIKEDSPRRLSSINPKLRGDVETLTMKALEKDRDHRYGSAIELAGDIRRYLKHEPILARRPSFAYVAKKYVRRHTWKLASISAGLLTVLAIVVAVTFWDSRNAEKEATQREGLVAYGKMLESAQDSLTLLDAARAGEILKAARGKVQGDPWEWRHLNSRVDQSIRTVFRPEGVPTSPLLGFSVDPTEVLVAVCVSGSGKILLCRLSDSSQIASLTLGNDEGTVARAVAFSSDGELLAAFCYRPSSGPGMPSSEPHIRVWRREGNWQKPQLLRDLPVQGVSSSLAFHPKRPLLATGLVGPNLGQVVLWDLENLTPDSDTALPPKYVLSGHQPNITSVAFSPDGKWLASGAHDYTVRLRNVERAIAGDGQPEEACLVGHEDKVMNVAFSPDGKQIASGSVDGSIRIWDVDRCVELAQKNTDRVVDAGEAEAATLFVRGKAITALTFAPDGERLVAGEDDGVLRVWDVKAKGQFRSYNDEEPWSDRRYRETNVLRGHAYIIRQMHTLKDGRVLSISDDGFMKLWSPDKQDVRRLEGHTSSVRGLAFIPGTQTLVSTIHRFIVWDVEKLEKRSSGPLLSINDRDTIPDVVAWRDDGEQYFAIGGMNGCLTIGDPTRSSDHVLEQHDISDAPIWRLAATTDGRKFAVGDVNGVVWMVERTGKKLPKPRKLEPRHEQTLQGLLFLDPDGNWLVSCSGLDSKPLSGPAICLWNPGGSEPSSVLGHDAGSAAFSVAGRRGRDGRIEMFATGHRNHINIWEVSWSQQRPTIRMRRRLEGHTSWVSAMTFHPHDHRLVSGSHDRSIKVWDTDSWVDVATLRGPRGDINDLAFDSEGRYLAVGSAGSLGKDNVVWVYTAPSE